MKRGRFADEQIIGAPREQEAGASVAGLRRKHGISSATFYAWKAKFGGMEVSGAKRLKALEAERAKLKRLHADATLDSEPCRAIGPSDDGERAEGVAGKKW